MALNFGYVNMEDWHANQAAPGDRSAGNNSNSQQGEQLLPVLHS
jgi:hypothetical protein